jgi:predicted nucleic acid-binding protein
LLVRGKQAGRRIDEAFGLSTSPFQHTISIVTHGEILVLSDRNRWGDGKQAVLTRALHEFVTIDISGERIVQAYREVERISAAVPNGAVQMGKNDVWIAATAIVAGQPLITTDGDFSHLNGVLLEVLRVSPTV